jgi:hypothetical protein
MRALLSVLLPSLLLAGCGDRETTADPQTTGSIPPSVSPDSQREPQVPPHGTRELLNPEDSTIVMLYHVLAGISPPLDQWVESDGRVTMARPADKPGVRSAVRAELESGLAAVRDAGMIRLTLNANLSDYDPNYGEFTVRALSPSSSVPFQAFARKVNLRFANARSAQLWRVPADQAQSVRDRIGHGQVTADVLLQIQSVHAAPEGGTITGNVIEYELRETRGGTVLGRVQPANQTPDNQS